MDGSWDLWLWDLVYGVAIHETAWGPMGYPDLLPDKACHGPCQGGTASNAERSGLQLAAEHLGHPYEVGTDKSVYI